MRVFHVDLHLMSGLEEFQSSRSTSSSSDEDESPQEHLEQLVAAGGNKKLRNLSCNL